MSGMAERQAGGSPAAGSARGMRVLLGHSKFPDNANRHPAVEWDVAKAINSHMLIVGASGTGKTYRLRKLMREMTAQNPGARFYVIDVHGDIQVENASVVRFSETTQYGLNPLKINSDPDFGGVRKRIRNFIATLNNTSRALGTKQESTLINLLFDLYSANGFYADDPRTWSLQFDPRPGRRYPKRHPTISDLKRFADYRLKQMITGTGSAALAKLEQLNKRFRSLDRANAKVQGGEDVDLAQLKDETKLAFAEYIDAIESGRELDDIVKYYSRDVMQSVFERIVNLESAGIFKSQPPPFDPSRAIRNYDIRALNTDEQKMFVDVLLEDLFFEARQCGETKSNVPNTFIILDESHKFLNEGDGHIINVMAREARKFGVGMILASQSLNHFPEDVLANTSTKIILGLDEMYHDAAARKLRIEARRFGYIVPQRSALIQVKNRGDTTNRYIDVTLA